MQDLQIPADAVANCANGGYPSSGNAGGNTQDWTNQSNYVTSVPQTNDGALWAGKGSGAGSKTRRGATLRRRNLIDRRSELKSVFKAPLY